MSAELDKIWEDDFFERREEAALLEQYLESIWNRPNLREDSKGFVLAVDADYGMGKTFFLKRFAKQMAINHPVAYIDAWKDDLHDEPLIAILATLEEALKPYFSNEPVVEQKFKTVVKKAQKIGGLMVKGVAFRALGAIFTPKIVDFIADTLNSNDTQIDKDDLETRINDAEKDAIKGAGKVAEIIKEESDLRSRISKFKESQSAIEEMKKALRQLVESLKTDDKTYAPIVIIIDELDRCRPTYAIKLLEEVKHLFDVEGLVFLLGTNLSQLSNSVSGEYGFDFDGFGYLNRFIDRKYALEEPNLRRLMVELQEKNLFPSNRWVEVFPRSEKDGTDSSYYYMGIVAILENYEIGVREAFKIIDILHTIFAFSKSEHLHMGYLLPMIIEYNYPKNFEIGKKPEKIRKFYYLDSYAVTNGDTPRYGIHEIYEKYKELLKLSPKELGQRAGGERCNNIEQAIVALMGVNSFNRRNIFQDRNILSIVNYRSLINSLSKIAPIEPQ